MPDRARLLLAPVGLLLVMLVALFAATPGFTLLDTYRLLNGTGLAAFCAHHGVWSGCGADVSQYALLQYLPAAVFHETGFSYTGALNGLVALSGIAALGVAALVAKVATRAAGAPVAALAIAVLLAGPLLWYAHAGFGEALAALAVTGFVASLLLRGPAVLTGLAFLLAGLSKETAVPFLLAFAAVVWLLPGRPVPARRRDVVAIAIGGLLAIGLSIGFNEFRYGTLNNQIYSQARYRVGAGDAANAFSGLFLSPTAGLLWMWPAFLGVLAAGVAYGLRARTRGARRLVQEPAIAILVLFLGVVVIAALWHAPFGGTTWGPRLLIPWLPAILMLLFAAYGREFAQLARDALLSQAGFAALLVTLLLAGLPQLIATVDSTRYPRAAPGTVADFDELAIRPYAPDSECPEVARIEVDREYYFRCLRRSTWNKGIVPAAAFPELRRPLILVYALVWCAAIAGLLAFARSCVRVQPAARA